VERAAARARRLAGKEVARDVSDERDHLLGVFRLFTKPERLPLVHGRELGIFGLR
jgi:hypothetical protein